jgi:hypothetical protein
VWFLKPKHTLQTVAEKLLEGLEDGTIVLENTEAEVALDTEADAGHAWVAADPRLDSDSSRLIPRTHDDRE